MLFDRQSQLYTRLLWIADTLGGIASLAVAYHFRELLNRFFPSAAFPYLSPELLPFSQYFLYFVFFLPVWVGILFWTQPYHRLLHLPLFLQVARAGRFVLMSGFLMGFLSYAMRLEVSRPILFVFMLLTLFSMSLNRVLLGLILRSRNLNEHNKIKIIIAGTGEKAEKLGRKIERFHMWGYELVGYLAVEGQKLELKSKGHMLGGLDDLPELIRRGLVVDEVIFISARNTDPERFESSIRFCEEQGIRTRIVADFFPNTISRVSLEHLEEIPLISFSTVPEHDAAVITKRVIDFLVAAASLVVLSPLIAAVAGLIKFTSPGPVFYRQVRCGLYGRRFELVKFRTMMDGAEDRLWEIRHLNEMDGPVFKMRDDPRVTAVGRFLRKYSIDEIPQFWNVIKGEMSIVGPRAPLCEEVDYYSRSQRRRLSVKPGITCLWQVSGRSDIDFDRWMELDLNYIDNWSIWLDFRIMLKTIPAVFTGRGAR